MILLDTHAWLWWTADLKRLSLRARKAMMRAPSLGVSVVSCWEAAMLAHRGRIRSDSHSLDWQQDALSVEKIQLVELSPSIAVRAASLQATHRGDPADWLIVATALELQVKLVSSDQRLAAAGIVDIVW